MSQSKEAKATMSMTAASVGKDLLQALIQEIKLLPDVWAKIPKIKQDDVIERLCKRVDTNIKMAVHLLASQGRTVVAGDLEQIASAMYAAYRAYVQNEDALGNVWGQPVPTWIDIEAERQDAWIAAARAAHKEITEVH